MNELKISLDFLKKLHRDIKDKTIMPANRKRKAKHALAIADKCDRLSLNNIPEVAVIRKEIQALFPQVQAKELPPTAPTKRANRKKPS